MNNTLYFTTTAFIFLILALLHVARIVTGWEAVIGGWTVPLWVSFAAVVISGYLAYAGFKLNR